ncbi:HlyD family type I secretion periplasmic adaptor subunit [Beggiatoa leptomitoformis]|uniref:Membrane fusion protein (MFP) family protein n=1 Tax=Beggiatoa leptomitoformis TaxID=288004 RepID=A0A2N9YB23_9GAMM|nr:HlyD family type I secretion periplasmic adaptor subunit [Beggiatoa leptomitoformis]ALG66955.1 HlyD family type I secretion periplasmic adaptor subunit [Beggiatoa leptomitoformis]AUI67676.1 HlyD family type I secretion periplasmic adaptor subunit [Beggiatoa leptomitoformis]
MREYPPLLTPSPSVWSHLITWLTLLFLLTAGIWANYATLDEVTRGIGKVIPSSQVQIVQNLEGGIISELSVKAGDIVEKGQILLRIDDTRFSSSFRENKVNIVELQAKVARLTAESEGKLFTLPTKLTNEQLSFFKNEVALANSRQQALQANLDILTQQKRQKNQEINELKSKLTQLQRSYDLVKKELDITEPLVKKGVMSEVELLRLQREASDLKGNLEGIRLSIPRAETAVDESERKSKEIAATFRASALTELNDNKAELARNAESGLALEDRVTRTLVRSPVKGTIKRVKVTTVGGVVQPGMDLVEIVPLEDTLLIEAQIRPSDIAFLHPGQVAMIKFTAYDFSIFGGLQAHLEHISADTILNERNEAFFLIQLRTEQNFLSNGDKSLPIIPGMTVNVDILTGKKTLLNYLLKPLKKVHDEALRER